MTALERKQRTEARLQRLRVKINPALPPLNDSLTPRPAQEVAARALALTGIVKVVNGDPLKPVIKSLKTLNVWDSTTAYERYVFEAEELEEDEEDALSWQTEALWVLLWALGKVALTPYPDTLCDLTNARHLLVDDKANLTGTLLESPALRPTDELLDQLDLLYRLYGLAAECFDKEIPMPANLNPQVIAERYHALQWLMQEISAWDE